MGIFSIYITLLQNGKCGLKPFTWTYILQWIQNFCISAVLLKSDIEEQLFNKYGMTKMFCIISINTNLSYILNNKCASQCHRRIFVCFSDYKNKVIVLQLNAIEEPSHLYLSKLLVLQNTKLCQIQLSNLWIKYNLIVLDF